MLEHIPLRLLLVVFAEISLLAEPMEPPPPLTLGDNPVAGNKLDVPYGGFDWAPLWMSLTAGMSTCLGAIWVFCHRPPPSSPRNRASVAEVIRPSVMCFSLALAGSVMITVSVVSIIPECLRMELNAATEEYEMIPIFSAIFMQRLIFHVLGYVLYFLLAKFAFPEPDEILGLNTAKEAEMLTIDDSNNMSHVPNNNAYDDSVEDSSHFQKEISSEKARLRRISGDIVNSTSRPMNGHSTHAEAESNEEIECASAGTKNNNSNNKSNTNAAGCLGKLSRYSSGDDLESTESKRAWRVAMLLAVSLSVHNFPEGLAIAASAMKTPQLGIKVTIGELAPVYEIMFNILFLSRKVDFSVSDDSAARPLYVTRHYDTQYTRGDRNCSPMYRYASKKL